MTTFSQASHEQECDLLSSLDACLRPGFKRRDLLGEFSRRLLEALGHDTSGRSNDECVEWLMSLQGKDQELIVAALIHLLAVAPQAFFDRYSSSSAFKRGVNRLVDHRLRRVMEILGIPAQSQPHEKVQRLEEGVTRATEVFRDGLRPIAGLDQFGGARQQALRMMNQELVTRLIVPLLPRAVGRARFEEAFTAVQRYLESPLVSKGKLYRAAEDNLRRFINDLRCASIQYVERDLLPFATSLAKALHDDFLATGLNSPGRLAVRSVDKKYPFGIGNADITLGFSVANEGDGVALDCQLRLLESDPPLRLAASVRNLADLAPRARIEPVEFDVTVLSPSSDQVLLMYELTWTDGDTTEQSSGPLLLELGAQPVNIPWDELEHTAPYSLEPVSKPDDLVGRREQVRTLVSRIRSPSVGSSWVYGQRRVGKTSLVKVLRDLEDLATHILVYVEAGDFVDPDVNRTVDRLGSRLCRIIRRSHPDLGVVPLPDFAGALAPLTDFLEECLDLVPELRLVMVIDEFDELQPRLYERSGPGDALFLSIRSISGKEPFGFILVGGERMPALLGAQGQALNKFQSLRVDYLTAESNWSDFEQLVRHPIDDWAVVTDEAVRRLYDHTSGNPYFTKFICAILFRTMLARRDAYVTPDDVQRAVEMALAEADTNQFQHFWSDGIALEDPGAIQLETVRRRRVLIAFCDARKGGRWPTERAILNEVRGAELGEDHVRRILTEFISRDVMLAENGGFGLYVRFFEDWLVEYGRTALALTLSDQERERAELEEQARLHVRPDEITSLVDGWPPYRGSRIDGERVRAWLQQFASVRERRLAFKILCGVEFYSEERIRAALRTGHASIRAVLAEYGVSRRIIPGARKSSEGLLISWFGDDGKSGHKMARAYADENAIYSDRVCAPERMAAALEDRDDVVALVLIDDIIGSGRTATGGLQTLVEPIQDRLREEDILVAVLAITGFAQGGDAVNSVLENMRLRHRVFVMNPLDDLNRCFREAVALDFEPEEMNAARRMAEDYGRLLQKAAPLGFDGGELALVFAHNCPNNSLPILWSSKGDWIPLFERA